MDLQDYAAQDLARLRDEQTMGPPAPPPVSPQDAVRTSAPPSPGAVALSDPAFAAFLDQRAHALGVAQDQANRDRRWADAANTGLKVSASLEGKDPDKAQLDANLQRAQQPVAQVLQRQAAADAAAKDYGTQQEVLAKGAAARWDAQKRDPTSASSRAVQSIYTPIIGPAARLLTAADAETASAGGQLKIAQLAEIARTKQAQAELARQAARDAETARHNKSDEDLRSKELGIQTQRLIAEQGQKGRIPETEAAKIVNMTQTIKAIDELERLHGEIGASAAIPGLNVGASGRYADAVAANLPAVVAGALPQGRETPGAMEEFRKMMPTPIITGERAKAAFSQLRQRVKENAAAQIAALRAGNYNPQQVAELERQAQGGGSAPPTAQQPNPAAIAKARASLRPGERLAADAAGNAHALAPGEMLPAGWVEVR